MADKSRFSFQDEIDKTHPMNDASGDSECDADALAMQLVGERHEKRDLVDLVRWLILQNNILSKLKK